MIFPIISKTSTRTSDEFLELRYLKLAIIGFFHKNGKIDFLVDIRIKQILKEFIKNVKLVNKVIENKYRFLSLKEKRNYNLNYKQFLNNANDLSSNISQSFFQLFLVNLINRNSSNNQENQNIFFFSEFGDIYKRIILFYSGKEHIMNSLFIIKEKAKAFTLTKIKKTIYSVQVFDKMIKLITKIVLSNSKFFFLNNIKYNYTLLKFCDKTMKLVNSILLFCLLCDINIPYYCFHSDLSIAGNCRMCLVQLDTSLKPIASCAVSISINSTIYTNTKIIQKAREGVLEFLLINHPLDCPICDQGGECDLQEQFITYGNDRGRFSKKMI
jgi:hypothetical protein